ncbi:Os12g0551200 [Oryza sativa Japonica Group]|uniref:Os12g0551200 protein n=2 Tax=Oryza sativa subsp. japonica TaxID=39947 RepID=A0A0P0YB40_ORYSJ|nr:hypothetical protein EE612_060141 [Oryza sativa]BAF29998.1 Os12g0551200 [Oryza sativa Japonica Group]BAT17567.1 Os12g0551200 [Oryza sativa Japonica Group]|eukprot:NP_001066979.1 Os12g0551200 [Oryza sativa Japonica Group]
MAYGLDHSEWLEVKYINNHALFVGYLSMAVKGVGFLVGLWTTVVLLGGFVSMLEKKDFWSLTIITLVQTAGVFDVLLNEKLRHAVNSVDGFLVTMDMVFRCEDEEFDSGIQLWRSRAGRLVTFIQAVVFAIILCPLAVLYLSGLVISTSLSLWRLIQHDYGDGDGSANLTPALNVLYSLALFQGVLFFYQWVSYFASFPEALSCISSLLDTTTTEQQEQQQQDGDSAPSAHYRDLMVLGRVILQKLAAADEHNLFLIGKKQSTISKAMLPVRKDLLHIHNNGHVDAWKDIVTESLQLMSQLVSAPGKTGDDLRSHILTIHKDDIRVNNIIICKQCQSNKKLHMQAINIFTQQQHPMEALSTTSSNIDTTYSETNIRLLVDIFLTNKDASTRKMAVGILAILLSDQNKSNANANATIIFKASDTVVRDLKTVLLDDEETEYRICAAEILEHLHRTKEASYLKKLMEAMQNVLPKILNEIFISLSPPKQGEKQAEKAEKGTDGTKTDPDIEEGAGAVASKDNVDVNDQKEDIGKKKKDRTRKLHAALLSLSVAIFEKRIRDGKDLDTLAGEIARGDSASSFVGKLRTMVDQNSEQTVNCLRILKIATRMIISLLKLEGCYPKQELENLMVSLSKASEQMFELEALMMLSSSDHTGKKTESFGSLVKEAEGLMKNKKEKNVATTPASTMNGNQ